MTAILTLSVVIQIVAAIVAIRLIRLTERRLAWSLIAAAWLLMAGRRFIPLYNALIHDQSVTRDLPEEVLALGISSLMLVGVVGMRPLFRGIKRTEAERRMDQSRFSDILEALPQAIFRKDRDSVYLDCNGAMARAAGLRSAADIAGKTDANLPWRDLATDLRADDSEVIETGIAKRHVIRILSRADGTQAWMDITIIPLRDAAGHVQEIVGVFEDITERKQAEEALYKSERKFSRVFMSAPAGISVSRVSDGRLLEINLEFARMFGYRRDEVVGRTSLELGLWPVAEDRERIIQLLSEQGEVNDLELRLRAKSGAILTIRFSGEFVEIEGEKVILSTFIDATERKRAEETLRESEERYRSLFENSMVGIAQALEDGRPIRVNQAYARMYGYENPEAMLAEISGAGQIYANAEDAARVARILAEKGELEPLELQVVRRDGTPFHVLAAARGVKGAGGEMLLYEHTHIDITERKRTEEALQRAKDFAESLIQTANVIFLQLDAAGNVMKLNAAAEEVTGYSRAEVEGRNWFEVMVPRDRYPHVWDEFVRITAKGEVRGEIFENPVLTKHGEERHILWKNTVLRESGNAVATISFGMDITDRKQAEEENVKLEKQLQQAQRMEAIGNLAGGVAHDFNNLLQVLLTQSQLLRIQSADAEKVKRLAQDIEQTIKRGSSLTRQLLLFSRRDIVHFQKLDINASVRDATSMLRRLVRANIAFSLELTEGKLVVEADRGQIDQILANLVVNASDAMPDGGKLVIGTRILEGNKMELSVGDTGHGISDEIRGRLFEPFFTTKGSGKGTGLGLSVVHGIVEQHRGRIEVDSVAGEGATFRIILPLAEESVAARNVAASAALAHGHGEMILVVEDEEGARAGLREILSSLGYKVEVTASAEEAEQLHSGVRFDLLLTDLILPGMTGTRLAGILSERWPGLGVLLMSGYTEDESLRGEIKKGQFRFLQKPFDMDQLAREVRAALDQRTSKP
ncbi:MAG TPA: PAS domain S-box protein [Thermoanaerobaculia bacterium]|nr:PAS domain S-box protein [Thermoanaerobaculia bacterium]